jgi:hypothetical protein
MGKARTLGRSLGVGVTVAVMQVTPAFAQESGSGGNAVPDPPPDASIPGSGLITELLGWLKFGALAAAVAGLLLGAIAIGIGYSGANYASSASGRRWLLGGLAAAVLAGLAHTIATTLYEAT